MITSNIVIEGLCLTSGFPTQTEGMFPDILFAFQTHITTRTTTDPLVPFFEVMRLRWLQGFGLLEYGTKSADTG